MKTVIVSLMLCMGCVAYAEPNQPIIEPNEFISFRLMSEPSIYQNVNIETWFGYGKGNSEFGGVVGWRSWTEAETPDDTQSAVSLGIYTMYHFPNMRTFIEDLVLPIEFLPDQIEAVPAIGLEILYDLEGKGVRTSPVAELRFFDKFAVYYKYNIYSEETGANDTSQIGISTRWNF